MGVAMRPWPGVEGPERVREASTAQIILVDRDPLFREQAQTYLHGLGLSAEVKADVADLEQTARHGQILFVDVALLGGRVREQVRALVDAGADVVLTTGYLHLAEAVQGLSAGAFELLIRPAILARLGKILDNLLERRDLSTRASIAAEPGLALRERRRKELAHIRLTCHEFLTVLAPTFGYISLLTDGRMGLLTEEQKEALGTVRECLDRLARWVKGYVNHRGEDPLELPVRPVALDMAGAIQWSVEMFRPLAEDVQVDILVEAPGRLEVVADRERLVLVMFALLSNAIRFNRPGGQVRVVVRPTAEQVRVEVADSGRGIAREHLERIFEPDFQVLVPGKAPEGLGLGLTSARTNARLLGGDLTAASQPGEGSTFCLCIPRLVPEEVGIASP